MKKFAFGFACVLAGCAVGATMPTITAQTFAPNPGAQRWQQTCEFLEGRGRGERTAQLVAQRGAEGWEMASVFASNDMTIGACFKRPAPH